MAIYKPTDCSPELSCFDVNQIPFFLECKIDSANTKVDAYKIKILNSENESVFEGSGYTLIGDLKEYFNSKYSSYNINYNNLNSGLNGTYIKIPFIVDPINANKWKKMTIISEYDSSKLYNEFDVVQNTIEGTTSYYVSKINENENELIDGDNWKEYASIEDFDEDDFPYSKYSLVKYDDAYYVGIIDNIKIETPSTVNNTVNKNQLYIDSNVVKKSEDGSAVNIRNGFSYKWSITLYQLENGLKPTSTYLYDMPITQGVIMGSNESRIQSVPSDKILQDYYVQPVFISGLSGSEKAWTGGPITNIGDRVLIKSYDATYGYIYPVVGSDGFQSGAIARPDPGDTGHPNGFQIYKRGNRETDLTIYQQVARVVNDVALNNPVSGQWTWNWVDTQANPGESYGQMTYQSNSDPNGQYLIPGINIELTGNERIVLNHQSDINGQAPSNPYQGSKYNGIFYPTFEVRAPHDTVTTYTVTVTWRRTPDADSWGELMSKIVKVTGGTDFYGQNIQIDFNDAGSQYGVINETPFIFVSEKPINIYGYTGQALTDNPNINNTGLIFYNKPISSISTSNPGKLYIRPFIGLQSGMRWIEQTLNPNPAYFDIYELNTEFWYVTFTSLSGSALTPEIDKTRYQIKTYFRESDENVFYLQDAPDIRILLSDADNEYVPINIPKYTDSGSYSKDDIVWYKNCYFVSQNAKTGMSPIINSDKLPVYKNVLSYVTGDIVRYKDSTGKYRIYIATNDVGPNTYPGTTGWELYKWQDYEVIVNSRTLVAEAIYSQMQFIQWKNAQWFLYDKNGELIDKSDILFDNEIKYTFKGIDGMPNEYTITLIIETYQGFKVSTSLNIKPSFSIEEIDGSKFIATQLDCDNLAVITDIAIAQGFIAPDKTTNQPEYDDDTMKLDGEISYTKNQQLPQDEAASSDIKSHGSDLRVMESTKINVGVNNNGGFNGNIYSISGAIDDDTTGLYDEKCSLELQDMLVQDMEENIGKTDDYGNPILIENPKRDEIIFKYGNQEMSAELYDYQSKNHIHNSDNQDSNKITDALSLGKEYVTVSDWQQVNNEVEENVNYLPVTQAEIDDPTDTSTYYNINENYNNFDGKRIQNPIISKFDFTDGDGEDEFGHIKFIVFNGLNFVANNDNFVMYGQTPSVWKDYECDVKNVRISLDGYQEKNVYNVYQHIMPELSDEDDYIWSDGEVITEVNHKNLIGQVIINNNVVESKYIIDDSSEDETQYDYNLVEKQEEIRNNNGSYIIPEREILNNVEIVIDNKLEIDVDDNIIPHDNIDKPIKVYINTNINGGN